MIKQLLLVVVAAVLLPGCSRGRRAAAGPRPRIVSWSPALTQILFDMGLGDHVVGVTTQCILPDGQRRQIVGDALSADPEAVLAARPDVVLIQMKMSKELESLRQAKPDIRFEHFQIESLGDVSLAMEQIGRIVGKPKPAAAARERFAAALAAVRRAADGLPRPRVLFAIGYERPFVAGKDTFVGEMIELAGGVNAGDPGRPHQRWRGADIEEIMAARPDVLVCQAAPGREDQTREYWLRVPGLPAAETARVHVVTDPRWTIPSTYSAVLAEQLLEMVHPGPAGGGPR